MVTGGGGGEHLSKTFSIFYMLNSKNRVFNPYFSIGTCPMRKRLFVDKSRVESTIFFIEKIPFSLKLFSGPFYGQSFIKTVRGPFTICRRYQYVYMYSAFYTHWIIVVTYVSCFVLCQIRCFIVSIPDRCLLSYIS